MEKTCPTCQQTFKARSQQRFCSRSCAKVKPLPSKVCEGCGETFRKSSEYTYAYWETQRFCSRKCRGNGKAKRHMRCEHCGEMFQVNGRGRKDPRFCSSRCYGDWRLAITEANAETQHRDGSFSNPAKRILLRNANYQCQQCGSPDDLEIDHVIPQAAGGIGAVSNGRVLCKPCHWTKTLAERRLMRRLLREHYGLPIQVTE